MHESHGRQERRLLHPASCSQVPDCKSFAEQREVWERLWRWAETHPPLQRLVFDGCKDTVVPAGLLAGGRRAGGLCGWPVLVVWMCQACWAAWLTCCRASAAACRAAGALRLQRHRPALAMLCSGCGCEGAPPCRLEFIEADEEAH